MSVSMGMLFVEVIAWIWGRDGGFAMIKVPAAARRV